MKKPPIRLTRALAGVKDEFRNLFVVRHAFHVEDTEGKSTDAVGTKDHILIQRVVQQLLQHGCIAFEGIRQIGSKKLIVDRLIHGRASVFF